VALTTSTEICGHLLDVLLNSADRVAPDKAGLTASLPRHPKTVVL
jgi:hypothetical protein